MTVTVGELVKYLSCAFDQDHKISDHLGIAIKLTNYSTGEVEYVFIEKGSS